MDAGQNRVLIAGAYGAGSVMLEVEASPGGGYRATELFTNPDSGSHTQPPVLHRGPFYSHYTINERSDGLVAMGLDGQVKWKTDRQPAFVRGGSILADGLLLMTDGDTQLYLDVVLDVSTTEEGRIDLVAGGFDAGIHLGEFVEKDMIAVRISADQRAAIVAAPSYSASQPKPKLPKDLTEHRCLNFRHGASGIYHWEFEKARKSLSVSVDGPLVTDDVDVMVHAALDGAGVAFTLRSTWPRTFKVERWCGSWRTGAHHSPGISFTTPAGDSNLRP